MWLRQIPAGAHRAADRGIGGCGPPETGAVPERRPGRLPAARARTTQRPGHRRPRLQRNPGGGRARGQAAAEESLGRVAAM